MKPLKYLVLTTLFLGLASSLKAEVSLSFDEMGQGAFTQSGSQFAGIGDAVFLDWRPLQFISFGVGGQFTYLFDSPSLRWLDTFDVGGRLFPFPAASTGEFYLQGGVGLNLLDTPGKYHGSAGFGWRQFLNSDVAMDMGIQYDFFSPLNNPINGVAGKVGLTFLFGKNNWSYSAQAGNGPTTIVLGTNWKGESTYIWKEGDNVQALAYAAYGDSGLYTLILDANKDLMYRDGFSPGDKLKIPAMPHMKIDVNPGTGQNGSPHNPMVHSYFWKAGDKLPDVAQKLYGDPNMYPLLIDGIENGLMDPSDLVPGKIIEVPSFSPGDVDEIHKKATDPGYIWWRDSVGEK